jgi:methionine-gamma-lyase
MRRRREGGKRLEGVRPESQMMSYGYHPEWSEGAIKPPLFQTSTFVFPSAEKGKEFFAQAYGLAGSDPAHPPGLIYSRLNNPDLEILEDRLNLWDRAEASAVFSSGMAAISTSLLALVRPGEGIAFARPVYGGTDYLLETILPELGIATRSFPAGSDRQAMAAACEALAASGAACRVVYLETPANPTMILTDIAEAAEVAHERGALCAVDNTFLGPLYQTPLDLGSDLVLYSATKYLGGHSDLLAGVALGGRELIEGIRRYRSILGTMLDPHTAWLLLRSLETAKLRMTCSRKNAERVAAWLAAHPRVARVLYPGSSDDPNQQAIYRRQCSGSGGIVAFELAGCGEAEAFRFLNAVRLIKLAVSLGGNESLIEHPATMTHADVSPEEQAALGITPALVRLSVGIEHPDDLIRDLAQAFEALEAVPAQVGEAAVSAAQI